ncbi:hypothetical protein B0H16DRAFT_1295785 [Mycena metata]|nr:hypothetical protein B0H16DRAFT_1295785 [Mycena metata]
MATSGSSNDGGVVPVRLLSDPNLNFCPDFASDDFSDIRDSMGDLTSDEAAAKLTQSWTKGNDKKKEKWAHQLAADRVEAQAAEDARQKKADEEAATAAKAVEDERLETEKKKPKLGDFDANREAPSFLESRISPFAQNKIDNKKYCLLYPFTPRGLAEAAAAALSSNDDVSSVRLSQSDDNQLTVQSGPASTAHKNMVRDNQLAWREFDLGKTRFLKEIIRAGWPTSHVDALSKFFFLIMNYDTIRNRPGGEQILMTYADRIRWDWHQMLGTSESFNISIINHELLRSISDEVFNARREKVLSG